MPAVFRLQNLRIGVRLRLVFACVLLSMMAGGSISLWQFHAIHQRVSEVSAAAQRAAAVMHVDSSVVMLMSRLHRAAENNEPHRFEMQAPRLLDAFRSETRDADAVLREIPPETGRQKLLIDSLDEMVNSLPARVASLIELARNGDWLALHARLSDQVDHTDEVGEQLMLETSDDLSRARNRLFEDLEAAERRAAQTLVISSLLGLLLAGVLAFRVTRSITGPLSALDRGALAIARGDFKHELSVTGADELTHLANAFNRMTRELAELYARESEARKTAERLNQTLQRANDDLSVFAYSASHDLQEPLRSISMYSQMLQRRCKEQLDSEGRQFLEYLLEAAGHMSALIKDLLTYIEVPGEQNGAVARTPAGSAIAAALANLRSAIVASHASVTYDDLPAIPVESIHLQQLFQNLISNAIKYRSDQPPVVHISVTETDGHWQFSVVDNGIGIDPKYRAQIFTLFRRLHHRTQYPGTGIGLAICQKIVERYGGKIWIESSPAGGSDFRFTFPR